MPDIAARKTSIIVRTARTLTRKKWMLARASAPAERSRRKFLRKKR